MNSLFDRLAESADRLCSRPAAFIAFNAIIALLFAAAGVDLANIAVSIVTADLVLMQSGASRRGFKALHAKIDELVAANPDARDELTHAEDLPEEEIEEMRR